MTVSYPGQEETLEEQEKEGTEQTRCIKGITGKGEREGDITGVMDEQKTGMRQKKYKRKL